MSQLPLPHSRDFTLTIDVLWLLRGSATCCYSQLVSSSLPLHNKWKSIDIFQSMEKWFSYFFSCFYLRDYITIYFFFTLSHSPPLLCPNFSFPLLIPGGTIKEHKVTGFVTREFSWNTKCAISSDTGWTLHHGIPGDHLKPVAFIRQSQGLFWWCKALPGALTWWRAEEAGGELDLAWIDAPNDEA